MRSIALDPITHDWTLTSERGARRLSIVTGTDAIAQRLYGRLRAWAGEWFLDTDMGLPARSFLGVKGGRAVAELALRRAILTCPGVATLELFAFTFDGSTRKASLAFRVRTDEGHVIEDNGFRFDPAVAA